MFHQLVVFFVVLRSNRMHLNTAISVFLMFQLFTCTNGVRIVQQSWLTKTSPRADVDAAPGAELLYTTELVAIHDPIRCLNSDDNLGLYMETLPISTLT